MDAERAHALFQQMYPEIHRYAARRSSRDVADEVLAETFMRLWARRHRVPADEDEQRAWIFGIARRQLRSVQRRERRHTGLWSRAVVLREGVPVIEPDAAVMVEEADQAMRCYRNLRPRDQEILQLLNWEGLSQREVAMMLDVSETVVRTRLSRARQRLGALIRLDELTANAGSPGRRRDGYGQESS